MKRSGQVALVLMGVTATTAAGAYLMPPRADCRPQTTVAPAVAPLPGAQPAQTEPCRRRSWGNWRWGSGSYSSERRRTSVTPSTAFRSTSSAPRATSSAPRTSTSTSSSRSGFGSTGRSISRSSSS